jgi:predicted PolB exonuclease-like 3'-5' exonuclease
MTKAQTLAALGNQLDSFYSLEQVINIVKNIEENKGRVITTQQINDAIDEVVNWAERRVDNLVDLDSAEFEISYNKQIELTSVEIDVDSLRNALEEHFMDFGEAEEDEVEENKVVLEAIANNEL